MEERKCLSHVGLGIVQLDKELAGKALVQFLRTGVGFGRLQYHLAVTVYFVSLVMRHTEKAFKAQKDDSARGLCAKVPQAEDAGLEALRDTECSEARDRRG